MSFSYKKGTLHCEDVNLESLARKHGTPLYVYSRESIESRYFALRDSLKPLNATICFAVKASSNLSLLKLLTKAGAGMDIVSAGELFRALCAGAPPQKIVFSGVGKTQKEILTAIQVGILSFNVESEPELELIQKSANFLGKRASVCLRYNPDIDAKTHPYISTGLRENKFGLTEAEILRLVKKHKSFDSIQLDGISVHIGSQILSLSPIESAFKLTSRLHLKIESLLGRKLSRLDLGGGLGVAYSNEKTVTFQAYSDLIKKYFLNASFRDVQILLEPGRSLVAEAGVLIAEVIYRKHHTKKDFLIVDAGMNDLIRPALYQAIHPVIPVNQKLNSSTKVKTDLVGPICESSDCFFSNILFSKKVSSGDLLAITHSGAYGFSMANQYNSRPRAAEILVNQTKSKIIRNREVLQDLIQGEIG